MHSAMIAATTVLMMTTLLGGLTAKWPPDESCQPCRCSLQFNYFLNATVKHVNCSNLNLKSLSEKLPSELEALDLSNNELDSKGIEYVCMYNFLKVLSLAHNSFTYFSKDLFLFCSNIIHLDLSGNLLYYLSDSNLKGLYNLQSIIGLETEGAGHHVFKELVKLKTLDLTLTSFAVSVTMFSGSFVEVLNLNLLKANQFQDNFYFGAQSLRVINLYGPELENISKDVFKNLQYLNKVSLRLPKLMIMPETLFENFGYLTDYKRNADLEEIILKSIRTLPRKIFRNLKSLKRLEIHNTPELSVSGLFEGLVNLKMLNLTGSNVVKIPTMWFEDLGTLMSLNMSNTTLRSLERQSFYGLDKVLEIDLSLNALRRIPKDTLEPMRYTIRKLIFRGNILKEIDDNLLRSMRHLQYLDISDNKISSISKKAFGDLIFLKMLKLQENKLTFLYRDTFKNQTLLWYLDLGSNNFNRVPLAVIVATTSLQLLFLPSNKILSVPPALNSSIPTLQYLSLKENPIRCLCRILSLRLYRPSLYIDAKCKAPPQHYNKDILSLDIADHCAGPRPKPGEKPTYPAYLPSLLPHEPHQVINYYSEYYNYQYGGSDYYDYETDMYDDDVAVTPTSPGKTVNIFSSNVIDLENRMESTLLIDQGSMEMNYSDSTETTELKGSYTEAINANRLVDKTEPLVQPGQSLDSTPPTVNRRTDISIKNIHPTSKTTFPTGSIQIQGKWKVSQHNMSQENNPGVARDEHRITCRTDDPSCLAERDIPSTAVLDVASMSVGDSSVLEDNYDEIEVPLETKVSGIYKTDSILNISLVSVLCGVVLLVIAVVLYWRRKKRGRESEYQVNSRNPVTIGV